MTISWNTGLAAERARQLNKNEKKGIQNSVAEERARSAKIKAASSKRQASSSKRLKKDIIKKYKEIRKI